MAATNKVLKSRNPMDAIDISILIPIVSKNVPLIGTVLYIYGGIGSFFVVAQYTCQF